MPQTLRPDGWVKYTRHRDANNADWDSGATLQETAQPKSRAQYNPHWMTDDATVEAIERFAYENGITIGDYGNRETRYCRFAGRIAGACSGEYTEMVFVECTSGFFHGRPISKFALRRLGVEVV